MCGPGGHLDQSLPDRDRRGTPSEGGGVTTEQGDPDRKSKLSGFMTTDSCHTGATTMMIELNRFMTTEAVRAAYGLPPSLADRILPLLPVAFESADGTRYHLESEVDQFFARFVRQGRQDDRRANQPAAGKPGRKPVTQEIAVYADELRRQGKTWKEVRRACAERWDDVRVQDTERVRATWRRYFGPAHRKSD